MHRYLQPGCIVEYLESNSPQIAVVLESNENRLRLLLPNRRESNLSVNRLLPWHGPTIDLLCGREETVRILAEHKKIREKLASELPLLEAWEMAQGEISEAPASWFAELLNSNPDENTVAAFGRALLNLKSHFRFQSPFFQIHDAETVEKRLSEEKTKKEKEALIAGGSSFLKHLWAISQKNDPSPGKDEEPEENVAARINAMLMDRVADPESQTDEALWQLLVRNLPDVPHLPLQLLIAWGKLPPHYNFLLDRAAYERGDDWWKICQDEVSLIEEQARIPPEKFSRSELPFISIDGPSTRDIDDAFYAEETEDGYSVTIALACPALNWDFDGHLDKLIRKRATSIYLPEGDLHMLPHRLGLSAFSLQANEERPALCITINLDHAGHVSSVIPSLKKITVAANLIYSDVEKILAEGRDDNNSASKFTKLLQTGNKIAQLRKKIRIEAGAIIMDRYEPEFSLEGEGWETRVLLKEEKNEKISKSLVAELMIMASEGMAKWAHNNEIAMLHRTQDIGLPKEYAGEWSTPEDMARIMKALIPSILEVEPKKHAALGVSSYVPITSPIRRYTDLINEYQVMNFLLEKQSLFAPDALKKILEQLSISLDAAGQVQRFRPRYWKLLYVMQMGTHIWWEGIITEENELYATVNFPKLGLFVRGKKMLFGERAAPGVKVNARLGKVNPLYNEIQIIEAEPHL